MDSPWGRQLVSIRGELSDRLKREVERLPERLRGLLGSQPAKDITLTPGIDQTAVVKTELLIELARVCAAYAPQLHLQQTIWNAFSELRSDLQATRQPLLDELRIAAGDDREFCRSKVAAAVKICAKVFNDDYAAELAGAAVVSLAPQPPPSQRARRLHHRKSAMTGIFFTVLILFVVAVMVAYVATQAQGERARK